jgi:hypothetical protein
MADLHANIKLLLGAKYHQRIDEIAAMAPSAITLNFGSIGYVPSIVRHAGPPLSQKNKKAHFGEGGQSSPVSIPL